jgi:hypothetical protein
MASKSVIKNTVVPAPSSDRSRVTSYDSAYEHSLEHWLEVKELVRAADEEEIPLRAAKAS